MLIRFFFLMLFLWASTVPLRAQPTPDWTTNQAPFRILGNVYYVGSKDLGAYLITTPQGHILLNANLATSVPQIRQNIAALGFRLQDIKILLNSQAHFDHTAGMAELKRLTHARLAVMAPDVSAVESGGRTDFFYFDKPEAQFAPVKVDRVLHDGDHVALGQTVLTARLTPGHTKGTTTWTMTVTEKGHAYRVVILGGATVSPGNNLVSNARYPTQAQDFEQAFRTLRRLPCDVFLGAHGTYFHLQEKYARLPTGPTNPFIDPAGYQAYLTDREQAFRTELAKQLAAQHKGG